jgi:glycolate oxidase iron-sulfur subunit
LQPHIASRLRNRKIANLQKVDPQVIATGNVGCAVQLEAGIDIPIVHTVELLDWATGGPAPDGFEFVNIGETENRSPLKQRWLL